MKLKQLIKVLLAKLLIVLVAIDAWRHLHNGWRFAVISFQEGMSKFVKHYNFNLWRVVLIGFKELFINCDVSVFESYTEFPMEAGNGNIDSVLGLKVNVPVGSLNVELVNIGFCPQIDERIKIDFRTGGKCYQDND